MTLPEFLISIVVGFTLNAGGITYKKWQFYVIFFSIALLRIYG